MPVFRGNVCGVQHVDEKPEAPMKNGKLCVICGKPLRGKQEKYCSTYCRNYPYTHSEAFYERNRARLKKRYVEKGW